MNRREMLKAIAPLSLGFVFKLDTQNGEHYVMYVNQNMVDASAIKGLPPNVTVIPIRVDQDETIEQAVKMYEVISGIPSFGTTGYCSAQSAELAATINQPLCVTKKEILNDRYYST